MGGTYPLPFSGLSEAIKKLQTKKGTPRTMVFADMLTNLFIDLFTIWQRRPFKSRYLLLVWGRDVILSKRDESVKELSDFDDVAPHSLLSSLNLACPFPIGGMTSYFEEPALHDDFFFPALLPKSWL